MVKDTIKIFGRIKPTKSKLGLYAIDEEDGNPSVSFTVPKDIAEGFINNKKEVYKFRFERLFDQQTKQDEIFEHVAQPVIDNVLSGYNGTIFAYGQMKLCGFTWWHDRTGSGKTFTITGGAERYIDRGIIPRTLTYIYDCFSKSTSRDYTVHISYLEIYNESGYDLLDPKHEASKLEDLPKVSLMEDASQNIHLKNLSTHRAGNEEEALNLLFLGDTNRMIAETPMNQASTRSHCIFTVHITSRESGSATVRRAKLHLVDLAGSERVSKTGVNGVLLQEAKFINISLHFLEHVIVSLSEKNRTHIPYRNSMMTSVLRDSLGGNCMTTMIATMSVEKRNVDESISTCRFAQRVALIKNDALCNEELDPKAMIQKLKAEIASLKGELAMATGEQRTDALSEEDLERCQEAVNQYLQDTDIDATIDLGADMRKIQQCFKIIKKAYLERRPGSGGGGRSARSELSEATPRPGQPSHYDSAEADKLKGLLVQRDNEINILVNMLKKEKKRAADAMVGKRTTTPRNSQQRSMSSNAVPTEDRSISRNIPAGSGSITNGRVSSSQSATDDKVKRQVLGELSMGRQEAFDIYRRDYPGQHAIEEHKHALKQRYSQAKALGEGVNSAKTKINKLKASIEQHRMSRVMQGLVDPDNPEPDEMEVEMKQQMEEEKQNYKSHFTKLKTLKSEIEHLQHLLEKCKVKLMKDFEMWWAEQASKSQEQHSQLKPGSSKNNKQAWNTPPVTPLSQRNSQPLHSISHESSQSSLLSEPSSQSRPVAGRNTPGQLAPLHARHSDTSGYSSSSSADQSRSRSMNQAQNGIPLTGDAQADADIMAFVKARQTVASRMLQQGHR